MTVVTSTLTVETRGNCDIIDITPDISRELGKSGLSNGIATVFIAGSTAGVTTIEYEDGLIADFKNAWERNIPKDIPYQHDKRWGDGNGYSHVRASMQGPSLTIPFTNKRLMLGTWQQVVIVDFDNRPRSRKVVIQFLGE